MLFGLVEFRKGALIENAGRIIAGRYEVEGELGRGAQGVVLSAKDRLAGEQVAVKLLTGLSEAWLHALRREVNALRLLRLPGVVSLKDDGMDGTEPFLVMELVEGRPFPGRDLPVSWEEIEETSLALLETLARVHWAGVVHRDVKPNNILVDEAGVPRLLDLGVSGGPGLVTPTDETTRMTGTPLYSAPEQLLGAGSGVGLDLYSLGVMLYESLAGRLPHVATTLPDLIDRKTLDDAPPLRGFAAGVPDGVAAVIDDLLRLDPDRRPRSAEEALTRLGRERRNVRRFFPADAPALLTEDALKRIFAGPDRIHHLREDAAAELFCRTRGRPDLVEAELTSWVRAGLARREQDGIVLSRSALEWLSAGVPVSGRRDESAPEQEARTRATWHAERACRMREGQEPRLYHLLRAGDLELAGREAGEAADRHLADGRPARALSLLVETILAISDSAERDRIPALLERALQAALVLGTTDALDRIVYLVQRSGPETKRARAVESIARAAVLVLKGDNDRAFKLLEDCGFQEDPLMERRRLAVRVLAGRQHSAEREAGIVGEVTPWAQACREPAIRASLEEWRGWVAYRRGDYREAVEMHLACARHSDSDSSRLSALLNAASAALEAGDLDQTHSLSVRAAKLARDHRHAIHEARAEGLMRRAAYRRGDDLAVDFEFLEALRELSVTYLEALLCLNEAAVAWRCGDLGSGRDLAGRCFRLWDGMGQVVAADLARALTGACGAELSPGEVEEMTARHIQGPPPGISAQVLALLAATHGPSAAAATVVAGIVADDPESVSRRREVLSLAEALAMVGVANAPDGG